MTFSRCVFHFLKKNTMQIDSAVKHCKSFLKPVDPRPCRSVKDRQIYFTSGRRHNFLRYSRRGPVLFLSAGGGGKVKLLQGCPGGSVYPRKVEGGGGGKGKSSLMPISPALYNDVVILEVSLLILMIWITSCVSSPVKHKQTLFNQVNCKSSSS